MSFEIVESLLEEEKASRSMLHMTSYENRMSKVASSFLNADLGNRYHLSTPSSHNGVDPSVHIAGFSCRALPAIHHLELSAIDAARCMFNAQHVELRLISGVHATITTIATMTNPGDTIYSIAPEDGGHFATKHVAESLGRNSKYLAWDSRCLNINLEGSRDLFTSDSPSMIFLDHGTPLFNLPVAELKHLLPTGAILVYDASHTLGLIAGSCFQSPLIEGADILQGNTHKTFPGPQKAIVMFRDSNVGLRYSESVSQGLVSSQHTHHSIALGITILEMREHGENYAKAMLENAQHLGVALLEEGVGLVAHDGIFTTSHELLINSGWSDDYLSAVDRLFKSGISVNGRIAFRQQTIRIGVQELTRRGMGREEMRLIANLISSSIRHIDVPCQVRTDVNALNNDFSVVHFSYDTGSSIRPSEKGIKVAYN